MKKFSFSLPADYAGEVAEYVAKRLETKKISDFQVLKKSLDARDKGNIRYAYTVAFSADDEFSLLKNGAIDYEKSDYSLESLVKDASFSGPRPVVVGAGPCGLFAALTLAELGAKPLLLERGKAVEDRIKDVDTFFREKVLDPDSNVLFGAGGAGTFSDGKLNTGTNNPYVSTVLYELAKLGAPEEITYLNKPHVGTDKLRDVVKNADKRIRELGGEIRYSTAVRDILV